MELILYADYQTIPEYFYDNIFHNSKYCSKIHILTNKVSELYNKISNLNFYNHVEIHNINEYRDNFLENIKGLEDIKSFRDGFWIKTINRYFDICNFLQKKEIKNVFHIENDVLIYTSLEYIYKFIVVKKEEIYVCRDNKDRALGSMIYIANKEKIKKLCFSMIEKIKEGLKSNFLFNDMQLLGYQQELETFPVSPNQNGIVDACCFGQCLGGIDPRNGNNTIGYVNPDSDFKPEFEKFLYIGNDWYYGLCKLHTLHIHSKELWKFTGDINLTKKQVLQVGRFSKNIIDYKEVDYENLSPDTDIHIKSDDKTEFQTHYLPLIKVPVRLHFGNCDTYFNNLLVCLHPQVQKIYAMNPAIKHPKIYFVPIGLANDDWTHGQKEIFYQVYLQTRKWKKTKGIFCSFNEETFDYRKELKKELENRSLFSGYHHIQKEFWEEMAQYKYVLCPRGNGFDTHRFWEALWLGCIPVVINNYYTQPPGNTNFYDNFLSYLRGKYNFLEITSNDMQEIGNILQNLNEKVN